MTLEQAQEKVLKVLREEFTNAEIVNGFLAIDNVQHGFILQSAAGKYFLDWLRQDLRPLFKSVKLSPKKVDERAAGIVFHVCRGGCMSVEDMIEQLPVAIRIANKAEYNLWTPLRKAIIKAESAHREMHDLKLSYEGHEGESKLFQITDIDTELKFQTWETHEALKIKYTI